MRKLKIYLFLYPIKEYFWSMIQHQEMIEQYKPCQISEIINARYRKQGYQISWLFFKHPDNQGPDISRKSRFVSIDQSDLIIDCGITFEQHTKDKIYPDENVILDQLIRPIDKLVLGGFHQYDCVDRLAKFAYELGIPVQVDEETTHMYFLNILIRDIPIARNHQCTLDDLQLTPEYTGDIYNDILKVRKNRPWLVQPTPDEYELHGI